VGHIDPNQAFFNRETDHVVAPTCHVAGRTKRVAERTRLVAARTSFVVATTKPVATRTLSSFSLEDGTLTRLAPSLLSSSSLPDPHMHWVAFGQLPRAPTRSGALQNYE
jgi:hypothetical protein